jgi:hypothetical protein
MVYRQLVAVTALACVASCAPYPHYGSYTPPTTSTSHAAIEAAVKEIKLEDDKFEQRARVIGYPTNFGLAILPNIPNTARIRSWIDKKTGAVDHQLYVTEYYDGNWRFYQTATDENATALRFVSVRRDVVTCAGSRYSGCSYVEIYGVDMDDAALRKLIANGGSYAIKVRAKAGADQVIHIWADMARRQIAFIEDYKAKNGLNAPPPTPAPAAVPAPAKPAAPKAKKQ